jgi:hypothetical protein
VHEPTTQLLAVQAGVPLATEQRLPQDPQLATSLDVLTSQPSAELALQSASGAVQLLMPHTPLTQLGVPPDGVGHLLLQAPQWFTFELVLTSQPLATLVSQLAKPTLQAMAQLPPAQDGEPLLLLHACPQPPQWVAVVFVLTSQPSAALLLQLPKPELQAMAQLPLLQDGVPLVELQATPQAPQWAGSVLMFFSQPSEACRLQSL